MSIFDGSSLSVGQELRTEVFSPQGNLYKTGNGGMIFHFVVLNVIWICTAILFNGLFFYVGVLPGTPFANTYYTTLADIIAYVSIRAFYSRQ